MEPAWPFKIPTVFMGDQALARRSANASKWRGVTFPPNRDGLTQRDYRGDSRAKEQTLRIWEKAAEANQVSRSTGSGHLFESSRAAVPQALVDRLAHLDQKARSTARLRETPNGWRGSARVAPPRAVMAF
jgi:hypothetical protein